ncbi:asparagine synthase (glutamine-hydrolyzing) [Streptomyces sp. NL15-2K]|uniref:asparagine synthase (glutamine-hydrolyzing) n=1 Tax=Streptomyces sp. NL15-2K TaxID=376149 RepID=UPI000F584A96|nr:MULTISPECIES: asparagine synthase (glutamine-hydrolyzing) [Actinomycetes]WKX07875.1 asparagine synthase (glutamine-hydrolyzing) [Kutzneria buriramensis]GCB50684.1 asparagine synthetase [glutamine-hydrolyzing] [Streptomyces sp. NL15-2K]
MCGIAGWVDFARDVRQEGQTLEAITRTMACRGPDAEGMWADEHAALGHRRLSIIDLDGGRQPMTAEEDGRVLACLTYSGEVYNFQELRQELVTRGHRFRTRSDTEVVLRGYLEWGEGLVDRLNGMYAFTVWDVREQTLLLVRDRMGVKPLYYFPTPDGVVFGSEPKAILGHPAVPRKVTAEGLREVLEMVKTPEHAVFSGMHEVRPGQLVRISRAGIAKRAYWALEAREHTDELDTTIATVRGLLEDIVGRQTIADVPLCSLLSGGLDSSAITALAHQKLMQRGEGPVRSFSVDFAEHGGQFVADPVRGTSDTPFVHDLVRHIGAEHSEVLIDSAQLADPELRASVLRALDLPPAYWGDMWPSLYRLFQAVRARSTVALSGESADEVFGGYRWFFDPEAVEAQTFPWLTSATGKYFDGKSLFDPGLLQKLDMPGFLRDSYAQAVAEAPALPGEGATDRRMRQMSYVNLTRFVQTLLDRKDRMSMAVGLEVRVPFCDHRLVEYVFNVPWEMKSFDGREKSLLRAATKDLLPESIVQRVKSPYPTTQDPAYEQGLRRALATMLDGSASPALPLLDQAAARRLLDTPVGDMSAQYDRSGLEMALGVNSWLSAYDIVLDL